jgi:Flp pilus assembly protein TadG
VRVSRDEKGAVAVIVGLCSLMIFAFAAYAIDSGRAWTSRRHLVTASDAGALAAAQSYASNQTGCPGAAADAVSANHSGASLVACTPVQKSTTSGYVTVKATATLDYTFAAIFGQNSKVISSTTTAQWGIPASVSGLRPFGLCIEANQQLKDWLANPVGTSGVVRVAYGKDQPTACGDAPGNWGVVDFDGGANSNSDIMQWTQNGYPGQVSVGDVLSGDTGAISNSIDSELSFLKSSGQTFALPVFDTITDPGANAQMHIVAFVIVKLVDYRLTGNQADRYFDVIFTNSVVSGPCCSQNGIDTGVRAIRICDVDTLTPNTSDPRAC